MGKHFKEKVKLRRELESYGLPPDTKSKENLEELEFLKLAEEVNKKCLEMWYAYRDSRLPEGFEEFFDEIHKTESVLNRPDMIIDDRIKPSWYSYLSEDDLELIYELKFGDTTDGKKSRE